MQGRTEICGRRGRLKMWRPLKPIFFIYLLLKLFILNKFYVLRPLTDDSPLNLALTLRTKGSSQIQNSTLLIVKAKGTYSYLSALNGQSETLRTMPVNILIILIKDG